MSMSDSHRIVIVGGGIGGLATALALHRKGLDSLVLERSNSLRAAGAAILVLSNGWRALDQLGVGMELRKRAICLRGFGEVILATNVQRETPISGKEEVRCLKRSDLIEALASGLPPGSIRFGCQVVAIGTDPITSFPVVHLHDGSLLHTKVLVGCEGLNSVVAKSLGLKETKLNHHSSTRGLTNYPNGHSFDNIFLHLRGDGIHFGLVPINEKLVHWFVGQKRLPKDSELQADPELLKDSTAERLKGLPPDMIDIVKNCEVSSLSITSIRYRTPWDLILANFRNGTTTVAGDAMHVMGPFLGQGGSAALEDAVVLARNLAPAMLMEPETEVISNKQLQQRVGTALDKYVSERKLRLLRLSIQSFLRGRMILAPSKVKKLLYIVVLIALFGSNFLSHTQYDCGRL